MKTHLPKRLRAALVAALASVSLSTAYAADAIALDADWSFNWDSLGDATTRELSNSSNLYYMTDAEEALGQYSKVDVASSATAYYVQNIAIFNELNKDAPNEATYVDIELNRVLVQNASVIGSSSVTGDMYARWTGSETSPQRSPNASVTGVRSTTLAGSMYQEYSGLDFATASVKPDFAAAAGSTVTGKSTMVIQSGTLGGIKMMSGSGHTDGGTYLQINGGTFTRGVSAGFDSVFSDEDPDNGRIAKGTHLLINGGTFDATSIVSGGNGFSATASTAEAAISGGVSMLIKGGVFNGRVTGNSCGEVEGGINLAVAGGTFNLGTTDYGGIYASGYTGKVAGDIELTISGDKAQFEEGYTVSAGSDYEAGRPIYPDVDITGVTSSTVTLKEMGVQNSLLTSDKNTVDGGKQTSDLVLDNVNATIQAQLTRFKSVEVKDNSSVVVSGDNAKLGGATTATVESGSTLTLFSSTEEGKLTITGKGENGATITKDSEATIVDDKDAQLSTGSKIQNAKVEAFGSVALNTELENVDLVSRGSLAVKTPVSGKNTLTVSKGAEANLIGLEEGKDVVFEKLTIGDKGTLKATPTGYDVYEEFSDGDLCADILTLGRGTTLVSEGDGKLIGSLKMKAGSILDYSTSNSMITFSPQYGIGWGSIEEHVSIVLDEWKYARLNDGLEVKLFGGTSTPVGTAGYCMLNGALDIYMGSLDGEKMVGKFSIYTSDESYVLKKTSNVPEPTTGTLSLFALAGLAARRRRKH